VANIKSQIKRNKQNEKAHQRNKAASKGVIHKNQAANRKSAMAKRYAELQQA